MKCFVIMPFSETSHRANNADVKISDSEWSHIFTEWIKKAVESFPDRKIICERSKAEPGNFVKGIMQEIYGSDITIADLTGQKPNVYYELGIRHALKLGTIIISQSIDDVPSDLRNYYCFPYRYTNSAYEAKEIFRKFEEELHKKIKSVVERPLNSDSPVSDFLQLEHYFQKSTEEKETIKIFRVLNLMILQSHENLDIIKAVINAKQTHIRENSMPSSFLQTSIMQSYYTGFLTGDYKTINSKSYFQLNILLQRILIAFSNIQSIWDTATKNIQPKNIEIFYGQLETFSKSLEEGIKAFDEMMLGKTAIPIPSYYKWVLYEEYKNLVAPTTK